MGMVVRTNMAALNANNSLAQASKAQQAGMQKLASGFKINKAADDASGLAISEKMKNQIKALDTAKDNCEDGANLIQTAEGYMNETHDILNRMTELAEKSANGTLGDEDRSALQDEMDQLCGEIDRIATTANFNGHKLLDGSIGSSDKLTLSVVGNEIKYSAPSSNTIATSSTKFDLDMTKFTDLKPGSYKIGTDGQTIIDTKNNVPQTTNNTADTGAKFKVGDTITLDANGGFAADGTTGNGVKIGTAIADSTGSANAKFTFNGTNWTSDDSGVKETISGSAVVMDSTQLKTDLKNVTFTVSEGINLQIGESSTSADRLEVKINSFHTDALFEGLNGFVNTTNNSDNDNATAKVQIFTNADTDGKGTAGDANKASTYTNGVTINIKDKDAASAAADAIRQVSNYVSDERGKLGAQQNRLDHTVNNLTTASENTTAANSRIRDTDMAKEMMAYTSKNVIAQAAQSMLAQANSQPQNVLSLLQ